MLQRMEAHRARVTAGVKTAVQWHTACLDTPYPVNMQRINVINIFPDHHRRQGAQRLRRGEPALFMNNAG
jgi:hypothetical protein